MGLAYYVVRVASNKEEFVRENLLIRIQQAGMEEKVPQVLVPTEKITEIKRQKKKTTERKCFPGYVLVEMDPDKEVMALIRETPGVGDFLGTDEEPQCLEPSEVSRILKRMEEGEEEPVAVVKFKVGDNVRIKDGFFENFEGEVEEINLLKGKVKVVVNIFNRKTPVDLEFWQIEVL
jgi:transcriptional antiterminator NusG